jgi:hypothetical protein
MKNIAPFGTEYPAQMGQAHGAKTNSPAIARKPAEFIRCLSGIPAAYDISEATNVKNDPMGIGKGMPV